MFYAPVRQLAMERNQSGRLLSNTHRSSPTGFTLRVGVNPCLGEIGHERFRILAGFESVGQATNGVRVAFAITRPSDLSAWAPGFGALI